MDGSIRISPQRVSALWSRPRAVISLLHWGGRAGLGVNTSRGLSLALSPCRWNSAPTPPCAPAAQPSPPQTIVFSGGSGVTVFPPGKILFQHIHDDARRTLNETGGFQWAFLRFCSYRGPVNTKSASLWNTPFLAEWPPPQLQITPGPLPPPSRCSVKLGIHRRFIWDAGTSVRTAGLGKTPSSGLNGERLKNRTFSWNSFSDGPRPLSAEQKHRFHSGGEIKLHYFLIWLSCT